MAKDKKKSFWSKPEAVAGAAILSIIALIVGFFLSWLIPAAISGSLAAMTTLIVILGILAVIFLDKRLRTVTSISFQQLSRRITSWFRDIDPMKILQKRIKEMEENLSQVRRQLNILRRQSHNLMEQILNNEKQIEEHLANASKAKNVQDEPAVIINANRAARLRNSNENLSGLLQQIENLKKVLTRMKNTSEIMLSDVRDQVEIKAKEREALLAGNTAMKSAMEILSGGQSRLGEFDSAMEAVADDISKKVGEMEEFMNLSRSFMNNIDLKQGIFDAKGMDMLEKFEKEKIQYGKWSADSERSEGLHLEDGSQRSELDLSEELPEKRELGNAYDDLFKEENK